MTLPEKDKTTKVWSVCVSGKVHGVGYRDACVRRAWTLGITGWFCNQTDGSAADALDVDQ